MVSVGLWGGAYVIQLSSVSLAAKVYWVKWTNTATLLAPTAWFLFAVAYADHQEWFTARVYGLLLVEPIIGLLATWANEPHGPFTLMWTDFELVETTFFVLDRGMGPLFIAHATYSYVLVVLGAILILRKVRRSSKMYHGQAALLTVGSIVPVLANVAWVLRFGPDYVNLTPVAFAGSGLIFAIAIFHYRLLDVIPVARDRVIESMRDGYLVTDETGQVVDSNPAARTLVEADGESAVGKEIDALLPGVADLLTTTEFETEGEARTEITLMADGDRKHLDVTVTALYDNEFVGNLVVLRDITEHRRQERRFRKLIENSSDVITVLDEDGTIEYQSPSVKRVLGHEPEDTEGKLVFDRIHPDDREPLVSEFQRGLDDPEFRTRAQYRIQNADGEWRVHEMVARNLLEDPDVGGFVVNARDVTERVERERALERTNERLDRFASIVSHDLRNPLNVAEGYVELLDDEGDAVEAIQESHERMHRIIEDVLALAREGAEVSDVEPVDLETLVEDAWEFVETKDATLQMTGDGTIRADESRLGRALENLFRNSIEHGGKDVTVTVGTIGDAGSSSGTGGIFVADDGAGLPNQETESLFEMGVSGDDGTGFGLAIVADVVEAHGWEIHAGESEDGGARFEISGVEVQ